MSIIKIAMPVLLALSLTFTLFSGCTRQPDAETADAGSETNTETDPGPSGESDSGKSGTAEFVLNARTEDGKVTVTLTAGSASGLCAFDGRLSFSASALSFEKSAGEEAGEGCVRSAALTGPGTVTLSWASLEPARKGEVLFELEFAAAQGQGEYDLGLTVQTCCDGSLETIPYEILTDAADA